MSTIKWNIFTSFNHLHISYVICLLINSINYRIYIKGFKYNSPNTFYIHRTHTHTHDVRVGFINVYIERKVIDIDGWHRDLENQKRSEKICFNDIKHFFPFYPHPSIPQHLYTSTLLRCYTVRFEFCSVRVLSFNLSIRVVFFNIYFWKQQREPEKVFHSFDSVRH